jgi:membrane-bound metal-dependent hydrolase YbcI (DUF457 family)
MQSSKGGSMLGKNHITFALTSAVAINGIGHVIGYPPLSTLTSPNAGTLLLAADVFFFYAAVAFGSLLPDIDQANSIFGHWCGFISKEIQHFVGHRHYFHSLLGLLPWALLSLGFYILGTVLLARHGLFLPAAATSACQVAFEALLFGCLMHLVADGLTEEGVPLLWPSPVHYGFPPNPRHRIRTGHLSERLVVYGYVVAVALLQALLFRAGIESVANTIYAFLALGGILLVRTHRWR